MNYKITLQNTKPFQTMYKIYYNNKVIGKKNKFCAETLQLELREYNVMLDKLWWVWNFVLFIPSFFWWMLYMGRDKIYLKHNQFANL